MSSIPKNTTFRCSEHIFDSTQVPVVEINNISSQRVVHENSGIRVIVKYLLMRTDQFVCPLYM
jgi:hypothetical protein